MKVKTIEFPYSVVYEYEDELFDIYLMNSDESSSSTLDGDKIIRFIKCWCDQLLGIEGSTWKYEFNGEDIFHFKEEKHRTLFLLKWTAPVTYNS